MDRNFEEGKHDMRLDHLHPHKIPLKKTVALIPQPTQRYHHLFPQSTRTPVYTNPTLQMPLKTLQSSSQAVAAQLTASAPSFLVVYASLKPETGLSWCGDCRDAEPFVEKYLGGLEKEVGVVYAGLPVE